MVQERGGPRKKRKSECKRRRMCATEAPALSRALLPKGIGQQPVAQSSDCHLGRPAPAPSMPPSMPPIRRDVQPPPTSSQPSINPPAATPGPGPSPSPSPRVPQTPSPNSKRSFVGSDRFRSPRGLARLAQGEERARRGKLVVERRRNGGGGFGGIEGLWDTAASARPDFSKYKISSCEHGPDEDASDGSSHPLCRVLGYGCSSVWSRSPGRESDLIMSGKSGCRSSSSSRPRW